MSANLDLILLEFNLNVVRDEKKTSYAFEDYQLEALQMMLYRGEQEVSLPPKAIETLLVLINNQGKILTKEELIAQIWQDTVVEESNLAHYLSVLRKTLGDTHDGKPFIETLRRRGYRFNGKARLLETTATENDSTPPMEHISAAPRRDVGRHGNILKMAEWRGAENPAAKMPAVEAAADASPAPKYSLRKAAMLAAAALTVVVIAAFFFLRPRVAPPSQAVTNAKNELTILQLTNISAPADATISPDGHYFVYHEPDGSVSHLWLQQTGQNNRLEIMPPWQKLIYGKTFSPDGQFIYFVAYDKLGGPSWLYRVPTLGGVPGKILGEISSPVSFSPDSNEMVFQRRNEQTRTSALIIAPATGGEERILLQRTVEQGILGCPAWSPNGNLIAFSTKIFQDSRYDGCTISAINPQTGEIGTLSSEKWDACSRMVWTPDGQGLVFIGTKAGEGYTTRRDQIYYLSYPQGEVRRLTTDGSRHALLSLGITDQERNCRLAL